ncbi:MAG: C4-dicarboxylate ABC transporter, partial [Campylobacteraceae bacterium]|nr:C4-dicarboxylate ABC transporter [Campylobacteraceae bacterium]
MKKFVKMFTVAALFASWSFAADYTIKLSHVVSDVTP